MDSCRSGLPRFRRPPVDSISILTCKSADGHLDSSCAPLHPKIEQTGQSGAISREERGKRRCSEVLGQFQVGAQLPRSFL
jgi:hypothetical protein